VAAESELIMTDDHGLNPPNPPNETAGLRQDGGRSPRRICDKERGFFRVREKKILREYSDFFVRLAF
jgi:hypothetical protein